MISTVLGTQIGLCGILLSARRSVGTACAEDCQILADSAFSLSKLWPGNVRSWRTVLVIRASNCRGLTVLPGTVKISGDYHTALQSWGPVNAGDRQILANSTCSLN